MADNAKIGAQDSLQEHSLKHYNESGVVATIQAFQKAPEKFTTLSNKIYLLETALGFYWNGMAHDAFRERFRTVFCQVRDLGDALGKIYDILMKAQLEFYKVDDGFGQQLREAVHNSQISSGSVSQSGNGQQYDSQVGNEYAPNLSFNPLPSKPVLVSTMGQAYIPDLSYVAMQRRITLYPCMPSPVLLVLLYQNLDLREQIAHTTDEALYSVLDLPAMDERPQLTSTTGEPMTADVTYAPMSEKPVLQSTIADPFIADVSYPPMSEKPVLHSTMGEAYFPDLSYATMSRRGVLKSILGAAVVNAIVNSLIKGETREQAVSRIGEAIVASLNGDYPDEVRDLIVQKTGEAIMNDLYGESDGGKAGSGLAGITDFPEWTANLQSLIDDAVSSSYTEWMFDATTESVIPSLYPTEADSATHIVTNLDSVPFHVQPVNKIVSFTGVSDLDGASVKIVALSSADHSNGQSVRQIIAQSVQEQTGKTFNASLLVNTSQSVSQTSFTISITEPSDNSVSLNALVQHSDTGASVNLQAVADVTQQLCSQCAVGDFSNLTFPVRAA